MAKTLTILRRLGRDTADFDLQPPLVIADHLLQRANNSARANNVPGAMYKHPALYGGFCCPLNRVAIGEDASSL
jgi:hypothetical protein